MKIYRFQKFLIFQIYTLTHLKFYWGKSFDLKYKWQISPDHYFA